MPPSSSSFNDTRCPARSSVRDWIPSSASFPKDFRYAVEIRNAALPGPDYRKVLENHGVAHVYNHWSYMPPLREQHQRMEDCFTAPFMVLRLLKPLKMSYEMSSCHPRAHVALFTVV
ncbi:MAG: DUF72 domain-containing protein [Nitrospira sp.]|nr:DUF72 domain-containing protein [Nitrospira sp.]